jgi:osmotically-inducible protein OsmY
MNRKITLAMLLASLAAVPVVFTTGCAVTQGRESTGRYVDDKSISAKVKTALYRDSTVKGTQVNVTTFQGVVQLSGFVENQAQKDRAGEIAQQVQGVQSVHNDLVVQTGR